MAGNAADWAAGGSFSVPKLLPFIFAFDARTFGRDMPIPFFLIQGRDDHVVSVAASRDYIDELHAPRKGFVVIDGGHFACFTNAAGFVAELRRYVR